MRKTCAALLVLVFLSAAVLTGSEPVFGDELVEDSWSAISSVPTNASASMGVIPSFGNIWVTALDGELYCFGGINQHERSGSYVGYGVNEKYNIETGDWTTITPPLSGSTTVVACQNKFYSIGTPTQVYDSATDTWLNRSSLPESLSEVKANVVDDKIYVISGVKYATIVGAAISDVTYVYDPELDSWSTMASIPTPVEGFASAVLDGKIYIMGGAATSQNYSNWVVDLVQIFDPENNQWTVGKPLPTGVYGAGACATSGLFAPERIYVVGGNEWHLPWVTSGILNPHGITLNQIYDPATGNWSFGASLPEPRWKCSLVNINDTLFVVGGENGPDDASYYDSPEKVILEIDRYIPSGYKGNIVPIATETPTMVPKPYDATINFISTLFLVFAILAILIAGFLLSYRRHRKTRN